VSEAAAAEALFRRFLGAIEAADLASLTQCLTADATMFLPASGGRDAVRGRAAIEARFRRMFAARGEGGREPLVLAVENFHHALLGTDHALADAIIRIGDDQGRRSIVFRRESDGWRILHVHASTAVAIPAAAAPPTQLPRSLG
jgi:ketosteroid isomerase-like protein